MSFHKSFATETTAITADVCVNTTIGAASVNLLSYGFPVQTPDGLLYDIFLAANGNVVFAKSTDGGITWSQQTVINAAASNGAPATWYDGWSGLSSGLIHVAYTQTHSTLYRTIDTANSDALSTETTIFSGVSVGAGASLAIARMRGGNVLCRTCIDGGTEGGVYKLANADVPNGAWAAVTVNEALASADQAIIMPGFAADNQDAILLFWDASADEISRQLYDDSGNSWSETSISTGMVELSIGNGWPNFAATPDLTNSQVILTAWTQADLANADLKCWTVTESAITAKTDVVLNSTDDQGLCAIGINTTNQEWRVWYAGKSDGSETFNTAVKLYMKTSTDSGTTWGAETPASASAVAFNPIWLFAAVRFADNWAVRWKENTAATDREMVTVPLEVAA